jgi:hypothetical protein
MLTKTMVHHQGHGQRLLIMFTIASSGSANRDGHAIDGGVTGQHIQVLIIGYIIAAHTCVGDGGLHANTVSVVAKAVG